MKKIFDIFVKCYSKYKEVGNYIIFGVLTTLVNYIVYIICAKAIRIELVVSTVIAWFVSVLFAYVTNRKYVFGSKVTKKLEIFRECVSFFWFRILSGVIDIVVMYVSVNLMGINDLIMKLASNFIVIALNYIFSKLFIFNEKTENKEKKECTSALDVADAPVNFFRYIIQLVMMIVVICIACWNFNIINLLLAVLLLIIVEIILEGIENYKYSKKEKKDNIFKKTFRFLGKNFHFVILIGAFIIRFAMYLKLQILPKDDFLIVLNASKELVNGINNINITPYFADFAYQTGMVIYDAVVMGLLGSEIWLHVLDCIYGSIICLFIYLIAKELFSKQSAIIVSILYCIGIYVSAFCGILTNYHIFTIFILMAIYMLIAKKYSNMNNILKYSIIAILISIANIFRPESIIYVIVVLAYIIINSLSKDKIKVGIISILCVIAIFLVINVSASFIVKVTDINELGLSNNGLSWDAKTNDENIMNDNTNSGSLKEKAILIETKEKIFWSNIPYELVFGELESKSGLDVIKLYDKSIFLFCCVNMAIVVLYSKFRNIEDKRLYLFYIIILANFFTYMCTEVNGNSSYIAKIIVYILAAGGVEIFRRNAEREAKELRNK